MKFTLSHPNHPELVALYGFDPKRGFWASVRGFGRQHEHNRIRGEYKHPQGALDFLVNFGFFTQSELDSALKRLVHEQPEEMPAELRRVAEVVRNLKTAAD